MLELIHCKSAPGCDLITNRMHRNASQPYTTTWLLLGKASAIIPSNIFKERKKAEKQ